jgi:hypothetical protein
MCVQGPYTREIEEIFNHGLLITLIFQNRIKNFAGNPAEEHHISDFRGFDLKSICEISVISGFSPWFRIKSL